jgi:hypothetical protein
LKLIHNDIEAIILVAMTIGELFKALQSYCWIKVLLLTLAAPAMT